MASRHFFHYAIACNAAEKNPVLFPKKGANRSYLLIENRSGFDIYINFDMVPTLNDGIKIANNAERLFDSVVPDNQIHVLGTNGITDQRVNITEAY